MLNKEHKELLWFSLIILAAAITLSFTLFGMTGIRVVLGIAVMSLPFYLILNNFELGEGEKSVFSLLLGLTIFPSLAYMLGFLMSFRMAIAVSFAVFILIGMALWKFKR